MENLCTPTPPKQRKDKLLIDVTIGPLEPCINEPQPSGSALLVPCSQTDQESSRHYELSKLAKKKGGRSFAFRRPEVFGGRRAGIDQQPFKNNSGIHATEMQHVRTSLYQT
jgi:hypothetical protein